MGMNKKAIKADQEAWDNAFSAALAAKNIGPAPNDNAIETIVSECEKIADAFIERREERIQKLEAARVRGVFDDDPDADTPGSALVALRYHLKRTDDLERARIIVAKAGRLLRDVVFTIERGCTIKAQNVRGRREEVRATLRAIDELDL